MIRLVVALNGQILLEESFDQERILIGRTPESDLQLDNPILSRRHAEIVRVPRGWVLRDLESTNGLLVNGLPKTQHHVNDGDLISVGKFILSVALPDDSGSSEEFGLPSMVGDLEAFVSEGRTLTLTPTRRSREAAVPEVPAEAHLAIRRGPPHGVFRLRSDCFHIGRGPGCELRLEEVFAPRRLAIIVRGLSGYSLLNVSSRAAGVYRNGRPISGRCWLHHGDRLEFRSVLATFREGLPV